MSPDMQHPLRKVAILVASLDEQSAARVLADLPAATSARVLDVAAQLGPLDPQEQSDIVREFRRNMAAELTTNAPTYSRPVSNDSVSNDFVSGGSLSRESVSTGAATRGVEIDASLLAHLDTLESDAQELEAREQESGEAADTYGQPPTLRSAVQPLNRANPAWVADRLIKEHPQTIAVALSRFDHQRIADVLARLPTDLQAEVLSRLADLDTADPQTLQVVESQLAEWLSQQQQQKKRMARGAELVQRILSKSPAAGRQTVLARISRLKPELAGRLAHDSLPENPGTDAPTQRSTVPEQPKAAPPQSADPMADLERADDATLLAVFSQGDRRTVMLALAGASESLLKRILRGMPRRQATQFRHQLRTLGPTRLSDMLRAQQDLAEMSYELRSARRE